MLRWLLACAFPAALFAVQYPSSPEMPQVGEPRIEGTAQRPGQRKSGPRAEKVQQVAVRLRLHLGDKSVLIAETSIPATYSFAHRKGQLQYNQTIKAEDIREIAIESYRSRKVASGKPGDVFEFEPATVRIELKDGQVFKVNYLFKDLRMLRARNADGVFSVFAYFADTWKAASWQERPGAPERPREGAPIISRTPHPAAYTRLEYFERLDQAPAAGESGDRAKGSN